MTAKKQRTPAALAGPASPAAASATPAGAPVRPPLVSLERARELLGAEAEQLTDAEISRMGRELEDYARLHVRLYDQRQQAKGE